MSDKKHRKLSSDQKDYQREKNTHISSSDYVYYVKINACEFSLGVYLWNKVSWGNSAGSARQGDSQSGVVWDSIYIMKTRRSIPRYLDRPSVL